MSAERLLREFERAADAPNGIALLRRFVLGAAVRGLVVPQDSADEDVVRLLGSATLPELLGTRRATLGVEFPTPDEVPFRVPSNWIWCRVNQVGAIIGGGTPRSGEAGNFIQGGRGIPWFTPADMAHQVGLEVEHGERDLTEKGYSACSATSLPKGTVLFTSRAPIGYVAIAKRAVTTNQGFKSLVPSSAVTSRYAAIFFKAFTPSINAAAPGTTFKEVSGKIVSRLAFPLPPLAEQHRIAAKVDELMSLCDQLEAAHAERELQRDALRSVSLYRLTESKVEPTDVRFFMDKSSQLITKPEHVAAIRQTIMDLAVQGRLVPQTPGDESADALVDQIRKATRVKCAPDRTDTDKDAFAAAHPPGWAQTKIGELFDVYVGSTPSRADPSLWHGDVPWVSSGEVAFNRIRTTRESISRRALGSSKTRLHPPGTVMLSMIGQGKTRGQAAILEISAAHN